MRIRIQHFFSLRIRIQFRIQRTSSTSKHENSLHFSIFWVIFCLPGSRSRSSKSKKCGSGSTTLTSRQQITYRNTPAVSEEVNSLIFSDKQAGRQAELCAPSFQLAQVRGTLAHVVNLHPHHLNLATLLSGGQRSDAYKKGLSTKNNDETH